MSRDRQLRRRLRVAAAIALPMLALGVQWLLWPWIRPFVWFLFFPTVFVSAWLGGYRGGLCSTAISAAVVWYFFIPPRLSWRMEDPANLGSVAMFLLVGYLISQAQSRLERANRETVEALEQTRAAHEQITQLYEKTRELDELKTRFFANVSHELRTPLTLILGPLGKRLAAEGLAGEERRDLEVMQRNARLLYRHVSDLLDVAKLEAKRMTMWYAASDLAHLTRVVASNFESLAAEKQIRFAVETPERLAAQMDREKCEHVLQNLLSNAFKFTPAGGAVSVVLKVNDRRAVLQVADTGPGVPAEHRQAIFERFQQVGCGGDHRFGGTGLGLAIVKEFTTLHGGTVAVGEAPEGGAMFTVELPLVAPPGAEMHSDSAALDPLLRRQAVEELRAPVRWAAPAAQPSDAAVILVVEDNADMSAYIAGTLGSRYQVVTAFDGQDGLEKAVAVKPDLIISDVMMPRRTGDAMVAALRQERGLDEVPIVILTAKADDALRVKLLESGVQDCLTKPFSAEELRARVEGLLAKRRRTLAELRAVNRTLRMISGCNQALVRTATEADLLARTCRNAVELGGHQLAWVGFPDPEAAGRLRIVAAEGGDEEFLGRACEFCFRAGPPEGPAARAMRTLQPVVIDDLREHAECCGCRDAALRKGYRSAVVLPLVGENRGLGVLVIGAAASGAFDAAEVALLEELSGDLGFGLATLRTREAHEQAEAALRTSHERLKKVLAVETVGVMFWDLTSGCLVDANDTFLRLMGYSRREVEARELTWQKLTPPEYLEVSAAEVRKFLVSGRVGPYEKEYLRKDGSRNWFVFAGSSLGANACVEFCVDISDRKSAEAALKASEERYRTLNAELEQRVRERTAQLEAANEELESFAYAVSHDLRAPLRAMSGFSQAIHEDCGAALPEVGREYLDEIDAASRRMGGLIDGLLTLSRCTRGSLRREEVDLSAMATRILCGLAQLEPQRRVTWKVQPNLAARCDERMMEIVLTNLLGNAWKYTGKMEQAEIEVGKEAEQRRGGTEAGQDAASASLAPQPPSRFFVRDNGAGFNMKHAARLFQPFQRLHRQDEFVGLGIGLATVQRIIHRHGGAIDARGEPGRGATFFFTLGGGP